MFYFQIGAGRTRCKSKPKVHTWLDLLFADVIVVFFDDHRVSCSHMQWPSILHKQSAIGKVTHPRRHLKRFVKLRELKHWWQKKLALKLPKDLVARLIPLLG